MEDLKEEAMLAFEKKDYVKALEIFSRLDDIESKTYENKCIDLLEDIIYYSSKKIALVYLEKLKFYKDYSYFTDTYKSRKVDLLSKILMFGSALIGTIILILVLILK